MTKEQWDVMFLKEKRIKVAELCGWVLEKTEDGAERLLKPNGTPIVWSQFNSVVPDYLNDLNAMHEAEKLIPIGKTTIYENFLLDIETRQIGAWDITHATAAEKAKAFVLTMEEE